MRFRINKLQNPEIFWRTRQWDDCGSGALIITGYSLISVPGYTRTANIKKRKQSASPSNFRVFTTRVTATTCFQEKDILSRRESIDGAKLSDAKQHETEWKNDDWGKDK